MMIHFQSAEVADCYASPPALFARRGIGAFYCCTYSSLPSPYRPFVVDQLQRTASLLAKRDQGNLSFRVA